MNQPTYDLYLYPLLQVLAQHPEGINRQDAIEAVAQKMNLTAEQRAHMLPSGAAETYRNRIGWAHSRLKRVGYLTSPQRGTWFITDDGAKFLAQYPDGIPEEVRTMIAVRMKAPSGDVVVNREEQPVHAITGSRILFKKVDYTLDNLLSYIDLGDIGLPDIQRPFVWTATKVRDLFDSMYRGFPVGYLLFWANEIQNGARQIGAENKAHKVPNLLIVDGQQRLTSLYAVFRGKRVLDSDYKHMAIEIAFRPRDGKFEVGDAATRRDPEFVSSVSDLWASGSNSYALVRNFLEKLKNVRHVSKEEEDAIAHNLDRLFDLQKYPFTALEIASTVNEEQVADIFVRINSQGVKLNQGDFILTLMSVFWDEGRAELEEFCRVARVAPSPGSKPSPYNHFISPDPDQLLRVAVAFGFGRGRLKSVYQLLRGKDLETDRFSVEERERQFAILKDAQAAMLNLTYWHDFFTILVAAGYRSGHFIASKNTLIYAYAFYLLGRVRYKVSKVQLERLIARWFSFTSLTSRYSGSFETTVESDLAQLRSIKLSEEFVGVLERIIESHLTSDFWESTLPNELETSSIASPLLNAYVAAQIRLETPALFSSKKIANLYDPALRVKTKATNQHHLFPKAWLERQGITDKRDVNQIANLAVTEWPENLEISDDPPATYLPAMRSRFDEKRWSEMCAEHALPEEWETMRYDIFLEERRALMADVIRKGFEAL